MPNPQAEQETPDYDEYDDAPSIGCYECDGGWRHGCMDDMCRGCNEAVDCEDAYPCRHCNPNGELPW